MAIISSLEKEQVPDFIKEIYQEYKGA